jgi:hypothetical protein
VPTLTITRVNATRHEIRLAGDDGGTLEQFQTNLLAQRAQQRLAAATGLPVAVVATTAAEVRDAPVSPGSPRPSVSIPYTAPAAPGEVPAGPFTCLIRSVASPSEVGTEITDATPALALRAALERTDLPLTDPVIQWAGTDRLCCLDIDYHALPFDARPTTEQLLTRAAGIRPRPFASHPTHGRGAKLYFAAVPGYTARELAAVAAVCWCGADRRATADLVRVTFHPHYSKRGVEAPGNVCYQTPGDDLAPVAAWLARSVDPEAVQEWLDARGYRCGQRLAHAECPIDPNDTAAGEPVVIGEGGIYCHRCSAKGLSFGRTPGFAPWASLIGGAPPRAAVMLKNAVHWTHARLVLRDEVALPDAILKPAYIAAVKLFHGAESPAAVGAACGGEDIIRMPGRWVSPDGQTTYSQNVHGMIGALPAVWEPGERRVLPDRRDVFLQSGDISHYGYYPVTPIHGVAIYGRHLSYTDERIAFAVPAPAFRVEGGCFAPRYRKLAERMPVADAWQFIARTFPGIHRGYVELLIAMKGLAEGATVQAPFVIATGPAKSGKSSTAHIAASICGDTATEPLYAADTTRLMQAIASGLDAGSFVVLNEIFKEAQKAKLKPRAAVDPILSMTPASVSHRLYIGPRPLGRLPALVLTDIEIPSVVQSDVQLARRLVWVNLNDTGRVEWEATVAAGGFGGIGRYRLSSAEAAAACDAVLSDVTDRFFRSPRTVADVAAELGFGTLEASGDCAEMRDTLRRFFGLVCDAPDLTGNDAERYPGTGWKRIDRGDTSELADIWSQLANGAQGDDWAESRVVTGEDWSQVLGVSARVHFDRVTYRGAVFVRFRIGPKPKPDWASKRGNEFPR